MEFFFVNKHMWLRDYIKTFNRTEMLVDGKDCTQKHDVKSAVKCLV